MGMHGREVEEMDEDVSAWWIEKEWRLDSERNGYVGGMKGGMAVRWNGKWAVSVSMGI